MSPGRKALAAAFLLIALALFLGLGNQLAGIVLFLVHKQNPEGANWLTLYHAWQMDIDAASRKKLVLSTIVGAGIGLGIPAAMLVAALRGTDRGLFGRARFASRSDVSKERLDAPTGVVLGRMGSQILRLPGYEFVLLAAPTRTGKGVGFVVPNLLTFEGSAFVLDIKGENYNLTSEFRRRYLGNEIFYFNPFSETTHGWNPLSYVSDDPRFRVTGLQALATEIYPTNEKDPFWNDSARNLFVGLALLVLETPALPKTIGEVLRQGSGKGQAIADYLRFVIELRTASSKALSETCLDYLNRFLNNSEATLKGIVAAFAAPLAIWGNPVIDKATSRDDFDLRDIRKRKMTIYTHIPAGEVHQAGFILNLLFSQLVNENVKELPEDNAELKHQCLLMLDECTAMGKVAILAKGVGYMAGYNLRLVIVIQDAEQLQAVYGKSDAHNLVSNMGAVVYFTPSQIEDAEKYSKMIGYDTVSNRSKQRNNTGLLASGQSTGSETESAHSRALMLPQELLALDKSKQLIVRAGIPVVMADKITYYQDPYFNERFTAVPMREVLINGQTRRVPIPAPLPAAGWTIYHSLTATTNYYLGEDFSDLMDDETEGCSDQLLIGILNEPESWPSQSVEASAKALAKRKVDDFLRELALDNREQAEQGPYRELLN